MKKLFFLFLFFFTAYSTLYCVIPANIKEPNLAKISPSQNPDRASDPTVPLPRIVARGEDTYKGKHPDYPDLVFTMERIKNREDQQEWTKFYNKEVVLSKKSGSEFDLAPGLEHFNMALQDINHEKNELWVIYIEDKNLENDPKYFSHNLSHEKIVMSCTVSSSPEAIITSHIGISKSSVAHAIDKARKQKNEPTKYAGISMLLHSFAARVMLMRNPKRLFMINCPTKIMGAIIYKAFQDKDNTVFLGTRSLTDQLLDMPITLEEYKENFESPLKDIGLYPDFHKNYIFPLAYRLLLEASTKTNLRYEFSRRDRNKMVAILEKHYPVIDFLNNNTFLIYPDSESEEPVEIITKGNPSYDFMFTEPFLPTHDTYFMVVDLNALADLHFNLKKTF